MVAQIFMQTGINYNDIKWVPYKGGGPSVQAVLAGECDFSINFPTTVIPHHEAGKMRIILFAGQKRHPDLPDVECATDIGLEPMTMDRVIMAPREIAQDKLAKLRKPLPN
jgi:tripartite-type tricarboxylate transporter receptor subunit TctC